MDYAVYKGEDLLCIGTVDECAEHMGVKPDTIKWYTYPTYKKRVEKRKRAKNYIAVVKLDDEEDENGILG